MEVLKVIRLIKIGGQKMEDESLQKEIEKESGEKEEEENFSFLKRDLDSRLLELGLVITPESAAVKDRKNFILELRKARNFEDKTFYKPKREEIYPNFRIIENEILEISGLNRQIENQVKMEIFDLQHRPLSRLFYVAKQFYNHRVLGKPQESAESIICNQISKVTGVVRDIALCTFSIDKKINDLEEYYDKVLLSLLSKYHETKSLKKNLDETVDLLSRTRDVAEKAEDFSEKLVYMHAHRKLRKGLLSGIHGLRLSNKAMLMLKNELPILDSLGSICETYSNALKETCQESILMKRHLENVMSLYIDVMRSQRVNFNLESEVKRLFVYTNNMNRALRDGALTIVEKANQSTLFEKEYEKNALTLDSVLGKIEGTDYNAFKEIEDRISRLYSS